VHYLYNKVFDIIGARCNHEDCNPLLSEFEILSILSQIYAPFFFARFYT